MCMCCSFFQALLLIIAVLLVTFSFSHSSFPFSPCLNRINTLYLDTPTFVFPSHKTCLCFTGNKNHTWCLSKVSSWLLFFSFDLIIITFVIIFGSLLSIVIYSCLDFSLSVGGGFCLLVLLKLCYWFERNWTCKTHHFLQFALFFSGLPGTSLIRVRITFVGQLSCHKEFNSGVRSSHYNYTQCW